MVTHGASGGGGDRLCCSSSALSITVDSKVGEYSEFTIRLPVSDSTERPLATLSSRSSPATATGELPLRRHSIAGGRKTAS